MKDRFKVTPASYVMLRKGDEILLIRRFKTGYLDGFYSLPAGHFEGEEPAETVAIREAREEVGVNINPRDLHLVHITHRRAQEGDHERVDFFFETTKWQGEPHNAEPDKCDEVKWYKLDELPDKMTPELTHVMQQIAAGQIYSSFNF